MEHDPTLKFATDGDLKTEGLHYVGKSDGDFFDVFEYLADGKSDGTQSRPVLEVLVAPDDKIWVAGVTTANGLPLHVPQETNGRVHRHPLDELDDETAFMLNVSDSVEPTSGICVASLYVYVYPRLATLMGRVYCPVKPPLVADDADTVQ